LSVSGDTKRLMAWLLRQPGAAFLYFIAEFVPLEKLVKPLRRKHFVREILSFV